MLPAAGHAGYCCYPVQHQAAINCLLNHALLLLPPLLLLHR
jgi:hypothetical protein